MNSFLLNRSIGSISPEAFQRAQTARLVHAIQPAPGVRFRNNNDAPATSSSTRGENGAGWEDDTVHVWAHKAGVNCLAIDKFEGR